MNYPDDIRQHYENPNSPFYDDSQELALAARADEIAKAMLTHDGYQLGTLNWNMKDVLDHVYDNEDQTEIFSKILVSLLDKNSRTAGLIFLESLLERHAKALSSDLAEQEMQQ